jgi:ABC-type transport system substrate-binding protein
MFETDEIYQMWEELLQLSDPAARDAQLRKIGNNKFEQFECIPLFNVFIRQTGVYIPELAEKWEMSPDGKRWTITLRKGVKFHNNWGEFTAKDMRHSVFLITQLESEQTDAGLWRSLMGIGKADTVENVAKKVEQGVQIVDDYQVVIHANFAAPELIDTLSVKTDLAMESKVRWDAGGKELYGQKVVGTGPFEFVECTVGSCVLYKRVENHWHKTPEYKELEFRWVPEGVTCLATLLAGAVPNQVDPQCGVAAARQSQRLEYFAHLQ